MPQSAIQSSTNASFESFALDPKLLQAVKANRYTVPTEIQQRAIPEIIKGRDLLASAETGAGKTVAFVLPFLQRLLTTPPKADSRGPRVLILTPTRELAQQITDAIAKMNQFTRFTFGSITGGVPYPAQENLLRRPLDILVATPGRLMDHMRRKRVDYRRLEVFILDEADRMLDMGFVNDMILIGESLPPEHQTLLFSATLEGNVQKIARQFLKDPVKIQLAAANKPHSSISQRVHLVDNYNHKRALLTHVLEEDGLWQAIVFTATKRGADELVDDLLEQGINCAALHGDMKQNKRRFTLDRMYRGQLKVLVATDVAGRGIDVKKLSHVINFDLPRSPEDYVHRIGRTGRCGEKGIAISLVGPKDGGILAHIERYMGQKLERFTIPGFESRLPEASRKPPSRSFKPTSNRNRRSAAPAKSSQGRFSTRAASATPNSRSTATSSRGDRRPLANSTSFTGRAKTDRRKRSR